MFAVFGIIIAIFVGMLIMSVGVLCLELATNIGGLFFAGLLILVGICLMF